MNPVVYHLGKWAGILLGLIILTGLMACGKKANPVIPAQVTPNVVEDLRYQIKGQDLIVFWTIPVQNTDGSPLTDLKGFRIRKGEWPTKNVCPTCPDQFQETISIDLKGPELPDVRIDVERVQLIFKGLKPGNTYFFQVTAVNKKEIGSKPSKTLRQAWEIPLKPPSGVVLKDSPQGLVISWNPSPELIDGSPPEGLAGYILERQMEKGPWQKVTKEPITGSTHTDSELQVGANYAYRLKALRSIQGNILESEASEEKEIVYTHAFPPLAVQDLIAASRPGGVELRWLGIETQPPSGYHIYKRKKGVKTSVRITSQAVQDTVFEDRQVTPGTIYYYSVSAVGSAPDFLEGPKSKEIEISYNP
jgi:hypothetical protein